MSKQRAWIIFGMLSVSTAVVVYTWIENASAVFPPWAVLMGAFAYTILIGSGACGILEKYVYNREEG